MTNSARAQYTNPLTDASMIALQVVRTSFGFHLRECMGSCFPPPPPGINLGLIRTLRNRSDKTTKDRFRKLIPKNDHVKNKDRQDPSAVLALTTNKLTDELKTAGYVCHTIIPELDKYSADNQTGMYPLPISVGVPSYGWIAFLSFDVKSSTSTLFKARLHSPVDKVTAIAKNLKARHMQCSDGTIFLASDSGPIKIIQFIEGSVFMVVKQKKKEGLVKLADRLHVPSTGTISRDNRHTSKVLPSAGC